MPNIPIDIKLPDDVVAQLTPPDCPSISLPAPTTLNLCSPFGGASFQGIVDVTKAIPDDCSLTFSILLQLPPFFISLGCLIKLLKLMKPLMDFIQAVPNVVTKPGGVITAVGELVPAVADVVSCFADLVLGVPKFIKDLILLIAKLLKCIAQSIKSLAELMGGIQIGLQAAQKSGNQALIQQLQCAQGNALAQAQALTNSLDIIGVILDLAGPLMGLMPGAPTITIPTFGSAQDAASMEEAANVMLSVATSLETIAKALPSC